MSAGMVTSWSQASGISMDITCGMLRPANASSSTALSSMAESLPPAVMMGISFLMSSPNNGDASTDCRAYIQFIFPRSVLISPLWQR